MNINWFSMWHLTWWRNHFWPERKKFVTFRDILDNIIRNRRVRNISIRKLAVKSMHLCSFATLKLFIVTFWDEMKDDLFSLWQIATFKMADHLISLNNSHFGCTFPLSICVVNPFKIYILSYFPYTNIILISSHFLTILSLIAGIW